MKAATLSRVLRSFDRPSDAACWPWAKAVDPLGYGRVWLNGGMRLAHRVVYELVAPIPAGMVLDHLCRVPRCVNPSHLQPVTQGENVRRGAGGRSQRQKTHCPSGHEYTEVNTYRYSGRRFCRACHNARTSERARRTRRGLQTTAPKRAAAGNSHHTQETQ